MHAKYAIYLLAAVAIACTGASCGGTDPGEVGMDADIPVDAGVDAPLPDTMIDTDEDGIFDSDDNCRETGNFNQADMDQDGFGDACDNCPTLPNAGQENADDDALGDTCDPRPTEGGDEFVFYGFDEDEAGVPAGWAVAEGSINDSGDWSVISGKLIQQALTEQPSRIYLNMENILGPVMVETAMTIDSLPADDALVPAPQVGLLAAYDNGAANAEPDTGYGCLLERTIPGPQTKIRVTSFAPVNSSSLQIADWELREAGQYRLALQQQSTDVGNSSSCLALQVGEGQSSMDTSFPGPTEGYVGLQTHRATAAFDYFMIYKLGGPL